MCQRLNVHEQNVLIGQAKNVLDCVAEQRSYGGVVEATSLVRTLDVKVEISRHGIVACGRWVAQLPHP